MQQRQKYGFTITEIADRARVSKSTISRWIKDNHVAPATTVGNKKFFSATVVQQYIKAHKAHDNKKQTVVSMTELLQQRVAQLTAENADLKKQIASKDKTIVEFGNKFAKLADQQQQLSLANTKQKQLETQRSSKTNVEKATAASSSANQSDNSSNQAPHSQPHQGFWQRLFHRG